MLEQKQVKGLSIVRACQYLHISRQAYYQGLEAARLRDNKARRVVEFVTQVRQAHPRLGTRKLHYLWHIQYQEAVGRDAMFSMLRQARLLVPKKRAYHKTTMSHHRFYRHPNLLKAGPEQVIAQGAEQIWVADITYLPLKSGFAYASFLTDVYSRKIVGYHVHESLHTEHVEKALRMALKQRKGANRLIHHSDRGIQYCAERYQRLSREHGITSSMTDGYDCYQNALAERINGILKTEYLLHRAKDIEEARKMVGQSVHLYNTARPHAALEYKTPDAVHRASLSLM